ncbi:hypothetical protein HG536_0C05960 [Torulaspora globosa]|uniref:BAR domain-containing protein n=1 Tax=Torulaspora globosa TaxID=48254 RepID=A0A7G3ZFZ1_9SACH|nr:uncharacterized protein HG536_0C05960 [Torulaspora globosa]QLL32427.1 hypothetical protein HG536_0C05960 [Torulaspora globosa]
MKSKVGAFYDPLFGRPKRIQSSKLLDTGTKASCQKVDSKFNELESVFRKTYANVAALYYSCENHKAAMKSFFYRSINLIEDFRTALEDGADSSHGCFSSVTPQLAFGTSLPERRLDGSAEILQQFYASSGLPNRLRDYCISRLSKQMYVIAKRLEDDFLFFEYGVQHPLKEILKVCSGISRILAARNAANVELMAIKSSIAEQEQLLQETASAGCKRRYKRKHDDAKLENATTKFDILNSLLKDNLQSFTDLMNKFMKEWFKIYYFTTVRISYALYHFSWSSPEFKKIAFTKLHQSQEDSISDSHILSAFHAQHDIVAREVDSLTITRFRDLYGTVTDTTVEKMAIEPFSF